MFTVLFISDDADLRAVAARVLRKNGCQVVPAAHAGHATLACMDRQDFDVIVVEDQIGGESGAAVAARLRRYCPGAHLVRMCDEGEAVRRGEVGIRLERPFLAGHLIDAVVAAAAATAAAASGRPGNSAGVSAG
jgi:CheY-like chemotaxis protein